MAQRERGRTVRLAWRAEDATTLDDNTERLLPTQFPKIRMISGLAFEANIFWKQVRDLEQAARQERVDEIYRILSEMNIGFCHAVTPLPHFPVPLPAARVVAAGV